MREAARIVSAAIAAVAAADRLLFVLDANGRLKPRKENPPLSHLVEIQTEVRDPVAIRAACERLKLPEPTQGTFELFSDQITGLGVQLPGWRYPLVCDTATGQIRFDNFNEAWGKQVEVGQFLQAYAVEKAKIESRRRGHSVSEQALADGSIKLTIQVAGGAA